MKIFSAAHIFGTTIVANNAFVIGNTKQRQNSQ